MRYRIGEKHPLHQKLQQVFDLMDQLKIRIEFGPYNRVAVTEYDNDGKPKQAYDLSYTDTSNSVDEAPPTFEWKLTFEEN